jgi:hypothetical protein
VADRAGFENRCALWAPRVRIPPSPFLTSFITEWSSMLAAVCHFLRYVHSFFSETFLPLLYLVLLSMQAKLRKASR